MRQINKNIKVKRKEKELIGFFLVILIFFFNPGVALGKVKGNTNINMKLITKKDGVKEYKLDNGLKVLLKENHSIPLVTCSIWYKVGSRNEKDGIRGIAHFLEHMMFKGTKKLKKGEISSTIQRHGGVFNAFTFLDGTAYYETVPPQYLEKMLELEADRMRNSRIDQADISSEKTVVISELQGGLNNPSTILDNKVRYESFDKSPYKHPIIGYEEDVKNIDSKTMKEFYNQYYSPNNSTLIVVGDFNEANAIKLIKKHYGKIKNSNKPIDLPIEKESSHKNERRVVIKRPGNTKLLEVVYNIPGGSSNETYPLNVLEEILITGNKSKLNKALIEKGFATEVYGGAEGYTDPGLFYIIASLTPETKHKDAEKIVLKEIDKLIKNPPPLKEINAAINRKKAEYLYNLDGTYSQAVNLGYFDVINDWKFAPDWPINIEKVTQADISNILKKYFVKENRTVGYFIPEIKKGEKYESAPITVGGPQHYSESKSKVNLKKSNPNPKSTKFNPFKYEKISLIDGSTLLINQSIDLPITYISGVIKGGSHLLKKDKELSCKLLERTIDKGTTKYTRDDIEEFLDNTGSEISISCDEESVRFSSVTLNENLEETTEFLFEILNNPQFPSKEVKKEKEKFIAEIIESKDDTSEIARRNLSQLIYEKSHPFYSNNFDEDIKQIKKFNRSDLQSAHKELIKNNVELISLVTNLDEKNLKKYIKTLNKNLNTSSNKTENKVLIPHTDISKVQGIKNFHIKEKYQSDAYAGHITEIDRKHPDFYKMIIANQIIGGDPLTSRLAKVIRDNNGLVYTVISYINPSFAQGEFNVYFGANKGNIDKTIELLKQELNKAVKNGVTQNELNIAKKSIMDSFVSRNLGTYKKIGNTILNIELFELGDNYVIDYPKIINSITLKDVNKAIKRHIHPEKLNISISGDYEGSSKSESKNKK